MRAWILVNAKTASLDSRQQILAKNYESVVNCHLLWGLYDAIVEINMESRNRLYDDVMREMDILTNDILSLSEIARINTLIVSNEKTKENSDKRPFAYIFVNTMPEDIIEVRDRFFDIESVQNADIVLGTFDIVIEIAVDSLNELKEAMNGIFGTTGISRTITSIVFT